MKILITWASWFLWKQLVHDLLTLKKEVIVVSRNTWKTQKLFGEKVKHLKREDITQQNLHWVSTIIHLAWAPINTFPRNNKNKKLLRDSRINTTKLLVEHLPDSCDSFICWSAIWYYPSSLEKCYDINFINKYPTTFMEKLCVDREEEAHKAKTSTRRVVHLRTWLVIWPEKVGKKIRQSIQRYMWWIPWSGEQRLSLITIKKRSESCIQIINNDNIEGPVNMVTKNIQLKEYMHQIAQELHRPIRGHIPAKIIKFLWGEATQLILWSRKITPTQIVK